MKLHTLKSTPGSRVEKHRVGRGHALLVKVSKLVKVNQVKINVMVTD